MKNADKPINPVLTQSPSLQNDTSLGLTKREYLAGLAMQSLINVTGIKKETLISKIRRFLGLNEWSVNHGFNFQNISKSSIEIADELLKQLEK